MSDRSFRDRLAHIADLVDLEQLDGLVNRGEPSTGDEEPSLHRLILGLEEAGENNHQQVHGGGGGAAAENHHPDDFDALVFGIVPDHIALFGLQHTPLTRAINEGKYELAEKLIASTSDPESFNDGSMVHAMSTGKGAFKSRARNLKIVRLLLEKGASPNFRTPNVLELPSETPFEVVINFYLSLLKLFRNKNQVKCEYDDAELLNTIGLSGEEWLDSDALISQTNELVRLFIEHGADVNLQTTNAGRTIFHEVIATEVTDHHLIERMVTLGALVNLTDVHGTTPFMDLVRNTDRAVQTHSDLSRLGKRVLIDAQNCSGETALWRSMFYGRVDCSRLVVTEKANASLLARVQEAPSKYVLGAYRMNLGWEKKKPIITNLPSLLAPLLFDSPCIDQERSLLSSSELADEGKKKTEDVQGNTKFSVTLFNRVVNKYISPAVDMGGFCSQQVWPLLNNLVRVQTDYRHLAEENVFQGPAMISLMFGDLTGGLCQLSIRKILNSSLFQKNSGEVVKMLKDLSASTSSESSSPVRHRHKGGPFRTSASTAASTGKEWHDIEVNNAEATGDSACVISSVLSDTTVTETHDLSLARVTLSEPDMSHLRTSTPFPLRTRHFRSATSSHDDPHAMMRIGDNWFLRENPQYQDQHPHPQRRVFHSLDGIELEISQDNGRRTVSRLQRMLQETDDMLERLQSEVNEVAPTTTVSASSAITTEVGDNNDDDEPSRINVWLHRRPDTVISSSNSSSSSSSSSSAAFDSSDDDLDDDDLSDWPLASATKRFVSHLRKTRKSRKPQTPQHDDDAIVRQLTPKVVDALRLKLGIPAGLKNCLELEVARLQLGAAVYRHATIKCDRDCEGNDEEESDETTTDDGDDDSTTSWDNSLSEPSFSNDNSSSSDTNVDLDSARDNASSTRSSIPPYEPTVPERPRILSSSSSTSSIGEDWMPGAAAPLAAEAVPASLIPSSSSNRSPILHFRDDWFSVVGADEHSSTRRYVKEKVQEDFDHSTASETEQSDEEEMPPLE